MTNEDTRRGARQRSTRQGPLEVHLLDVGPQDYGDAVVLRVGGRVVLIDGAHSANIRSAPGHRSIPEQLTEILGPDPTIDLLVVSHAHMDHIGCLPDLVSQRLIKVEWALVADPRLSWGRSRDAPTGGDPAPYPLAAAVAGLREEPPSGRSSDSTMTAWLADAASLEERYLAMIASLTAQGTNVVPYRGTPPTRLLRAFRETGLRILGPSEAQLLLSADALARQEADARSAADRLLARDSALSVLDLWRQLSRRFVESTRADAEGLDASRPGQWVNLQSVVLRFDHQGERVLLGGDMQFASPGVGGSRVKAEVDKLVSRVKRDAPFGFVKVPHHGSANAFDARLWDTLGNSRLFGITTGAGSPDHPDPRVLALLGQAERRARWLRTDRNGYSVARFTGQKEWTLETSRSAPNDRRPNTTDVPPAQPGGPPLGAPAARPAGESPVAPSLRTGGGGTVEVHTTIPHVATQVRLTIEIDPRRPDSTITRNPADTAGLPLLDFAAGRRLPPLLYVTDSATLRHHIGSAETDRLMEELGRQPGRVVDTGTPGDDDASMRHVHEALKNAPDLVGVVLIGNYDVVPSVAFDCVPAPLRSVIDRSRELDQFLVWTDDQYGRPADGRVLPVSRVPDGRLAETLFRALSAPARPGATKRGVRNVSRPFADEVFGGMPGTDSMLISEVTTPRLLAGGLEGDQIYLMLHGAHWDGRRFWGEQSRGFIEAVDLENIRAVPAGSVVFSGACWGALPVVNRAADYREGLALVPHTAESSLALGCLARGARAFVGCTGAHYSPIQEPYGYFGGPLHRAFWAALAGGAPPALALSRAKLDYLAGMPHGRTSVDDRAIEHKLFWQFNCLGLGW